MGVAVTMNQCASSKDMARSYPTYCTNNKLTGSSLFEAVMRLVTGIDGSRNQGTNFMSRFGSGISVRHDYKGTRGEPVGCRSNVDTNHCGTAINVAKRVVCHNQNSTTM